MTSATWAGVVFALAVADEKPRPSVFVDGHKISIDNTSTTGLQDAKDGRPSKTVSFAIGLQPKDAAKSYAFEVGQRLIARDAAGNEIAIGRANSFGGREPTFLMAGYPITAEGERYGPPKISYSMRADATTIAAIEGDLFVSEIEVLDFTFSKEELNPNVTKKSGEAEARLILFDADAVHGADIGFKFRLPIRNHADSLAGGRTRDRFFLYASEAGRKFPLYGGGQGGGGSLRGGNDNPRIRTTHWEFHGIKLDRRPDALHLVIPLVEYPRRHTFRIKDVPIPPPLPIKRPQAPGRPIAAR
jgi:hypothetical protein